MTITITPAAQLLAPAMSADPLQTSLANLNELYQYHGPALVSLCPTADPDNRPPRIVIPIRPSADALAYVVRLLVRSDTTDDFDVEVEYTDDYQGGGTTWTMLDSASAVAISANTTTAWAGGGVIPADAEALRVFADLNTAGQMVLHHVLVHPDWDTITAPTGVTACGFTGFDNTMLMQAGAAIHTEYLTRIKASSVAVLRDRWQCAFSFAQAATGTPDWVGDDAGRASPPVRLWLPFQGPVVTLQVALIADVSGGATADLVRLVQYGVTPTTEPPWLDCDGTVRTATLQVKLQGEPAQRYADLYFEAYNTGGGNTTRIRSLMAWWIPGD